MSAVEQYRAGFEAWASQRAPGHPVAYLANGEYQDYATQCAWVAWLAAMQQREASTEPMCERKTAMLEADGWKKSGYVLKRPGDAREVGVSDGGAVAWFTRDQWHWLMFNRDHVEFAWPKPLGAAGAGALPDEAKDAARLEVFINWYLRGGTRSEIHPYGHIEHTTREIVLAWLDREAHTRAGSGKTQAQHLENSK